MIGCGQRRRSRDPGTSDRDSARATAAHGLGWTELSDARFDEAEACFRDGLRHVPGDRACTLGLAWTLTKAGSTRRLDDAIDIAFGLADGTEDPAACVCLGVAHFKRGDKDGARYWLEKAIRIDSVRGSHFDLGALYAYLGYDDDLAEKHLRISIERDPSYAPAHVELGALLLKYGTERLMEAARSFQTAMKHEPSAPAAIGLFQCKAAAGDEAGAQAVLEDALDRGLPDAWKAHLALARLLVRRAEAEARPDLYAAAYGAAKAAVEGPGSKDADAQFVAGLTSLLMDRDTGGYGRAGKRNEAIRHFNAALKRNPAHHRAAQGLRMARAERAARRPRPSLPSMLPVYLAGFTLLAPAAKGAWKHVSISVMPGLLLALGVILIVLRSQTTRFVSEMFRSSPIQDRSFIGFHMSPSPHLSRSATSTAPCQHPGQPAASKLFEINR